MQSTKVPLRQQAIVCGAEKSHIFDRGGPSERVRELVVQLQERATFAATARAIDVCAPLTIARGDRAPDLVRDVLACRSSWY
jgi:hypothetical protein